MSCTLSLCIIAKDEEHQISRCINSAKPFVDQIVVVDTGSSDNTIKLAEQLGTEVYQIEWRDDFSEARNKSLSYATGDWILFLDCDEELDQSTGQILKDVINNQNYDGYWLQYINIYNNKPSTNFLAFRLFRNNPNFRFESRIHEQVLPSVLRHSTPGRIGESNVTVYHYGYENDEVINKNKTERNIRMLKKAREDYGEAGFINFYLGVEHQRLGNYCEALAYYNKSLNKSSLDESYTPAMIRSMAYCFMNTNEYRHGLNLINRYQQVYSDYTDLIYIKGILYFKLDDYSSALDCMNQCLVMGAPPKRYFSIYGIDHEKPIHFIKMLLNTLIQHSREIIYSNNPYLAFPVLTTISDQLNKTPDEQIYFEHLKTTHLLLRSKNTKTTNSHRKETSIIIVTYNSLKTLPTCINSILDTIISGDEVIIVDNNSTDGTREYLQQLGSSENIKIIYNKTNVGFSLGCNIGYSITLNDYIVLLNPDTIVTTDWLENMQKYFTNKDIGAVGPVSNYVAGKQNLHFQIDANKLTPDSDIDELVKILQENSNGPIETKLLIGFCMMLPRSVINKVGFLDNSLFLGNDDLELSWRLKENGFRLLIAPDVFIYHKGQVSFNTKPNSDTNYLVQHSTNVLAHKIARYYHPDHYRPENIWGINWFKPSAALTSIIIPCYNQLEYTKLCLESIFTYTMEPFELIVINNGSSDGTKEYLKELSQQHDNVKVINNEENLGYGAACNQGLIAGQGDYFLILNNDTVVTEGWLARMLAVGDCFNEIGIIGPRSNAVAGVQLINNVSYKSIKEMRSFSRKLAIKYASQGFETNRVIGLCMMIKREVIKRIGGFDLRFGLGNFEDDDFCLRARITGYKIWVCNDVFIHHFGSKTFSGAKLDYNELMKNNWIEFTKKWSISNNDSTIRGYNSSKLINQEFNHQFHYCPVEDSYEKQKQSIPNNNE
ncbi:MAG: glycosyltransferase [Firmicutes bacterium]|nr:glycosyltransferase [Bacillota bacterium]